MAFHTGQGPVTKADTKALVLLALAGAALGAFFLYARKAKAKGLQSAGADDVPRFKPGVTDSEGGSLFQPSLQEHAREHAAVAVPPPPPEEAPGYQESLAATWRGPTFVGGDVDKYSGEALPYELQQAVDQALSGVSKTADEVHYLAVLVGFDRDGNPRFPLATGLLLGREQELRVKEGWTPPISYPVASSIDSATLHGIFGIGKPPHWPAA